MCAHEYTLGLNVFPERVRNIRVNPSASYTQTAHHTSRSQYRFQKLLLKIPLCLSDKDRFRFIPEVNTGSLYGQHILTIIPIIPIV